MAVSQSETPGASRADRVFNFSACFVDAIGFPLGIAFFSSVTILPILLRRLGADDLTIGCLPALANLLMFLPGLLVVRYLNRLRRVRGYLFWVAIAERAALLPLVALTPIWWRTHPDWMIAAVFVCIAVHTTLMGLNQPSYWMAVAKTIPAHWRGRLFGFAGGVAGVLSIGVEQVMARELDRGGGFPYGFSHCFLVGFILLFVSMLPLGALREPFTDPPPESGDGEHIRGDFRRMGAIWRDNHGFRRFLYSYVAFQLATMAAPFYILHATRHLGAGPVLVAEFTGTMVFASSFGGLLWGAWADRAGNKIVLIVSTALSLLAPVGAMWAGSAAAFYAVFGALALGGAGLGLAGFNIVMEFATEAHDIPLYTATANAVTAIPRAVAPLAGGLLASLTGGYQAGFLASAVLTVVSVALAVRITEPRLLEGR